MILSLCDFCLAGCRCDSTAQKVSPLGTHGQTVLVFLNLGRTQPQAGGPQGMHSTLAGSCSDRSANTESVNNEGLLSMTLQLLRTRALYVDTRWWEGV